MKIFRPIVWVADIVCVVSIAFYCVPAQAKQCHTERPSDAQAYWSYRLIDGRKCWYEGRPGYSKSLLHWSSAQTEKKNSRKEPEARPAVAASKVNPLDAQASITSAADAQAKPDTADRIAAPPSGNLTKDDLRAWGNKMALAGEPVLTIMDRWPDQELQQQRAAPASAAQSSSANGGRAALTVVIMMMALSAVLMTTLRKKAGTWRLPFWPTVSRKRSAAWY